MRILLLLFSLAVCSFARKGLDFEAAVQKSGLDCLKKNGFDFMIARVWHSYGNYDETGISNIKQAHAAGWTDVGAYIYPCVKSSCASGAHQVEAVINKLKAEGAVYNMLWMDIEGTWPSDKNANRVFIQGMVDQAVKMGVKPGIYTGQYSWPDIVGDWTAMSKYPLWWPNYNGQESLNNFPHYGGWTKAFIHQYKGDLAGPCGLGMDLNFKA